MKARRTALNYIVYSIRGLFLSVSLIISESKQSYWMDAIKFLAVNCFQN